MSSIILTGDTSGTLTVSAPLVAGSNTLTLPAQTGTLQTLGVGTSVASTSGTSIDFTGIPSWAKRITVMLSGVSTNGTSIPQIQIGSGSVVTTGYLSQAKSGASEGSSTTGFIISPSNAATYVYSGTAILTLLASNIWVCSTVFAYVVGNGTTTSGGNSPTLSGALDRVRITTVNGTDAFDAGSINIMYEG